MPQEKGQPDLRRCTVQDYLQIECGINMQERILDGSGG
jgi:hypothetical protein